MNAHFDKWRQSSVKVLKALKVGCHPKEVIAERSESLLVRYAGKPLIDAYGVYQHLMDYWAATMQDDCYLIAADGWKAETARIIEIKKGKDGKGKEVDKGWACDLVPKSLMVKRYYAAEQATIDALAGALESAAAKLTELEEEHGGEDGAFAELEKVNKAAVTARLKEIKGDPDAKDEAAALSEWLKFKAEEDTLRKQLAKAESELDDRVYTHYPKLTEPEVKALVVDDKWLGTLDAVIHGEMDRVSQQLTQRVKELAERYETRLPALADRVAELQAKVNGHLERMGYSS